ncbi:CoA pyrophosphatase [Kiloniella laminariae]|uniref:CoA pyrophosphatase n=1 Tax=Kiloniella laminariae TaxID=454162 RepID=A0ABT4LL58_9PROT|nr:CoA pyrophosphatase [Kiloniella laminariae]MCZ4281845.1 CoA pyrophosphatase [Kiloniella laminariae]
MSDWERNWTSGQLSSLFAGISPGEAKRDAASGTVIDGGASRREIFVRGDHDMNPDFYEPERTLVPAAVIVPLIERSEGFTLLLTRRTDHLHDHAGQVSFPGGRIDPGDLDQEDAALREFEEEVGVPRNHVSLIGRLDTYITRTGFEITPVVGLIKPPFPVNPDSFEVAEVFEVPLNFFLKPGSRQRHNREFEGRKRYYYAFPYQEYFIWGATAGMIVNLCDVLSHPETLNSERLKNS